MSIIKRYVEQIDFDNLAMTFISKVGSLILLVIAFTIIKKIITLIFNKTLLQAVSNQTQDQNRQRTLLKLCHNTLDYSLYFILAYSALAILGLPISSLLAGAGIAGLAIGLGAQGFLTDLVNGIFILIERQFDVGDTVTIQNVTGIVTNLGIRTTQLLQFDGTYNYIPNRNITLVSNLSRGKMRAQIDLPIPFAIDLQEVQRLVEEVNSEHVEKHPEVVGHPVIQGAKTLPNGQVIFRIDITTNNGKQHDVYREFYHLYQEKLLQSGLLSS